MSASVIRMGTAEEPVLVPLMPEDARKISKIKFGKKVEISMKVKRDHKTIGHVWACVNFVFEHCTENYDDYWSSTDELYQGVKFEVGYVELIGKGDKVYRIPRHTNFTDQKDEQAFNEEFAEPALQALTNIMKMNSPFELTQASIEWSKMKHDGVFT